MQSRDAGSPANNPTASLTVSFITFETEHVKLIIIIFPPWMYPGNYLNNQ